MTTFALRWTVRTVVLMHRGRLHRGRLHRGRLRFSIQNSSTYLHCSVNIAVHVGLYKVLWSFTPWQFSIFTVVVYTVAVFNFHRGRLHRGRF